MSSASSSCKAWFEVASDLLVQLGEVVVAGGHHRNSGLGTPTWLSSLIARCSLRRLLPAARGARPKLPRRSILAVGSATSGRGTRSRQLARTTPCDCSARFWQQCPLPATGPAPESRRWCVTAILAGGGHKDGGGARRTGARCSH
jgi:hypothetical protein